MLQLSCIRAAPYRNHEAHGLPPPLKPKRRRKTLLVPNFARDGWSLLARSILFPRDALCSRKIFRRGCLTSRNGSPTGKSSKSCPAHRAKTFRSRRRANQMFIGSLLIFQEAPYVRPIFRACRDLEAQRRFQKELRQTDWRTSLFAVDQCRARLFNPLECVCTCHSLLGLLAANTMLASAEMEFPAPNVQQRSAKAADKMVWYVRGRMRRTSSNDRLNSVARSWAEGVGVLQKMLQVIRDQTCQRAETPPAPASNNAPRRLTPFAPTRRPTQFQQLVQEINQRWARSAGGIPP